MTFLNMALLAGMAALAVPLLIHLLSRRRYTPIAWGAMFLIEQVMRQNRRRLRLEQWLLLAIRCAIPVVLALAMARPVMTGWQALAGDEPTSMVVILDASYSMSAATARGTTAAQEAEAALRSVIQALPKDSQATVLIAGSGTRILEQDEDIDTDESSQIAAAELGPVDAPAAIAAAEAILKDARHRRREIVLISDFQTLNFASPAVAARASEGGELRPQLSFLRIDTTAGANLLVEDVALSPAAAGAGRPVRVRAAVRNASAAEMRSVPVRLVIDGQVRDETRLNLAAGASSEANFITRFEATGPHSLEVQVEGDSLWADNNFRLAVDVPESLGVLLVGGQSDLPFPQNPTDFLSLALDPQSATKQAALSSLLRPQSIKLAELSPRTLADARVVVLANVPSLAEQQVGLLREFVSAGGGLIVFPGDRTNISLFNSLDLFPARLLSLRGESSATRITEPPYAHSALLPWNDPGNGRLGEASIRRWYSLQPRSGASAILGLESGEPLLVEQPLGRGSVIMAATSAGSDWSDLPLRAGFLPLVQQLVTYAAARATPPRTVYCGEPLAAPLAPEEAQNLTMFSPSGSRHVVSATLERGRTLARFAGTSQPGFYRLERSGSEQAPLAIFAVNAPRAESDLSVLSPEQLQELAGAHGATVATSVQEYAALDHDRRYGREVWGGAWLALLGLLFGELLLQAWFANSRDGATAGGVT